MKRRILIIALASAASGLPPGAFGQTKKAPVVIGWLDMGSPETSGQFQKIFTDTMATLGRREGEDFVLETRWAHGRSDRMTGFAEEIAARKPAVIVSSPRNTTIAVAKVAKGVPIVQASGGSPTTVGLAASLAKPGGNVTGLTNLTLETSEKNTELVLDIFPGAQRVGYLVDLLGAERGEDTVESARRVANRRNILPIFAGVARAQDVEKAFAQFQKGDVQAVVLLPNSWFDHERKHIMEMGMRYRLPVIGIRPAQAEAGALASYGWDRAHNFRRAAWYVDQILKGVKPGDLPIEQPAKFELVVNLRTAKALGITIPPVVMVRADRVIQ